MTDDEWLKAYDSYLQALFGITANDTDPTRYRDLEPFDAAMAWGSDYDLDRIDQGWK